MLGPEITMPGTTSAALSTWIVAESGWPTVVVAPVRVPEPSPSLES